ncbi:hypothetical protein GCM10027579_17490 [Calidifontibacter terrae]
MTLAGMTTHLIYVEDYWINHVLLGNDPLPVFAATDWEERPDRDWEWARELASDERATLLRQQQAASDGAVAEVVADTGLDTVARRGNGHQQVSLRWILTHLIEEYARHVGHADLIRESIDGSVGQ